MKNKDGNHKILDGEKACRTAADIQDFEDEIEAEELLGNDKFDWRVARVGDVGSDSWNANMQEIDLELKKLQAQHAKSTAAKNIKRMQQLAGIAMPKVEALAVKQAKRQPKKH